MIKRSHCAFLKKLGEVLNVTISELITPFEPTTNSIVNFECQIQNLAADSLAIQIT